MRTKTNNFYSNLSCMNYDVIVLTETWLNNNIGNSELFDDRYEVYRRDRETTLSHFKKEGGGVLIAVRKNINSTRVDRWQSGCEDLWITIDISTSHVSRQIALCAVYLPPPVCAATVDRFVEHCNMVFDSTDIPVCLIGDFNLGQINWNVKTHSNPVSKACQNFMDFTSSNGLAQHNFVKNCSGRILDLVLSTVSPCSVVESLCPLTPVDKFHPPLEVSLSLARECTLPYNKLIYRPNFYKANYTEINNYLNDIDWDKLFHNTNNVNEMLTVFYTIINDTIEKFVPKRKPRSSRYPPWFTKTLIKFLNEKNRLRMRYKKYRNPLDAIELTFISKQCQTLAKNLYKGYVSDLEKDIKDNPKLFWSFLKTKRGGSSVYPLTMTNGQTTTSSGSEICDLFADYFASVYVADKDSVFQCNSDYLQSLSLNGQCLTSPIIDRECLLKKLKTVNINKGPGPDGISPVFILKCASSLVTPLLNIFNKSLGSGTFPTEWKKAKVVPVHKNDKKNVVSNYRPISILSTLAKIFESIICPYIQQHFKMYVSEHQHGFVASRSTTTNLVAFTETLVQAVDANKQFDVIYTDFSKAFDVMSHSVLIYKLSAYGITGPLLEWLKSYLMGREFYVVVNGFQSSNYSISSGAPQGSQLAPILFNIFINDLPQCFRSSEPFLYADDLKFARAILSPNDRTLLQEDLDNVIKWCKINRMQLNSNKCYHVKFTRKSNVSNTEYFINNKKLQELDVIKDLGVMYDKKVTFEQQMESVIKKASKMLGFILRNTKGFHTKTKIMLYYSLVRSILEYCSVVWRPHYATHTFRLERVQKRFLWHLAFCEGRSKRLPSYRMRLHEYKMRTLSTRRDLIDAVFLYKLLRHKIDCPQLLSLIRIRVPSRYPRTAITPFCLPLRRTVLGANSPIPRLCRILNYYSDLVDIYQDSTSRLCQVIVDNPIVTT